MGWVRGWGQSSESFDQESVECPRLISRQIKSPLRSPEKSTSSCDWAHAHAPHPLRKPNHRRSTLRSDMIRQSGLLPSTHLDWLMCNETADRQTRRSSASADGAASDSGTCSRPDMHEWHRSASPAHAKIFLSMMMWRRAPERSAASKELKGKWNEQTRWILGVRYDWLTFRQSWCRINHRIYSVNRRGKFSHSERKKRTLSFSCAQSEGEEGSGGEN